MNKLPTIIFADENHFSPYIPSLLTKLLPELKKIGYDKCYYEGPNTPAELLLQKLGGATLKAHKIIDLLENYNPKIMLILSGADNNEMKHLKLHLLFDSLNQEVIALPEVLSEVMNIYLLLFCIIQESDDPVTDIGEILDSELNNRKQIAATLEAQTKLFLLFVENDMYCGIDDDESRDKILKFNLNTYINHSSVNKKLNTLLNYLALMNISAQETLTKRDSIMAAAYLKAEQGVIGFTGLAHMRGLQYFLMQEATSLGNYLFIYPYFLNETHPHYAAVPILKDTREKQHHLPLDTICINAVGKDITTVVQEILSVISIRLMN